MIELEHFTISEFTCPCCGVVNMDGEFLEMLDKAREIANIRFDVNSGFRCQKHNAEIGSKPNSAHTTGHAADIKCLTSRNRFLMINALLKVGFLRIEISDNYLHVDNDRTKPAEVIWLHPKLLQQGG